ncbi:hypothetical protein AmDm5_1694 [Acetobacter malorum]|nr:hypothetical protein AmDm5_1694 [Acetobacter malorum]
MPQIEPARPYADARLLPETMPEPVRPDNSLKSKTDRTVMNGLARPA